MTGREGPGPERPGPDYPPEWDTEPDDLEHACTCLPYSAGGDGPERDCPVHGEGPVLVDPIDLLLTPDERARLVRGVTDMIDKAVAAHRVTRVGNDAE